MADEEAKDSGKVEGEDAPQGASDEDKVKGLRKALEAAHSKRQVMDGQLHEMQGQIQVLTANQNAKVQEPPPKAKDLSAAELRQAVESGRITEDESVSIQASQMERRIESRVEAAVSERMTKQNVNSRVDDFLNQYKEAIPELADRSSDAFAKAKSEFNYFVNTLGDDPNDLRTELKAARAAFGDVAKIGKAKAPLDRETYGEAGGGDTRDKNDSAADGAPKGLSPTSKKLYEKRIEHGMYSGWDDKNLKKEIADYGQRVLSKAG